MLRKLFRITLMTSIATALAAGPAHGWGPNAQRLITTLATQMLRAPYPEIFVSPEDVSYSPDVMSGAVAGIGVLGDRVTANTEEQVFTTIESQIQLLRAVRKYGLGSYFSYRMGVLASLASNAVLPYAIENGPESVRIRKRVEADIDAHVERYTFRPDRNTLFYVREPGIYFRTHREFFDHAKEIIALDYAQGKGYDGYLKNGAEVFFLHAVLAVADVWHTVLSDEPIGRETAPSPTSVTWYLAEEIGYLLAKGNQRQAEIAYTNFASVNPGIMKAYESVGDLFYSYGARERGVREWKRAIECTGAQRAEVVGKIARHYIALGDEYRRHAGEPRAQESDLPSALEAFTEALKYDRTNETAAQRISDTNVAIAERQERFGMASEFLASAEGAMKQAESSSVAEAYDTAIANYQHAVNLFEAVGNEFEKLDAAAKVGIAECKKRTAQVLNTLIENAHDAIAQGDRSLDNKRFQEAMEHYRRVENILQIIEDDPITTHGREKRTLLDQALEKIRRAEVEELKEKQRVLDAQRATAAKS